jgi:hypothetical protein
METQVNSINQNGCSVCKAGEENYTTFRPAYRPNQVLYQYDYRDKDGELFSAVAPTLEQCRTKRDKWVQEKSIIQLFNGIDKMYQYAVVYSETTQKKTYRGNANFFTSFEEAEKDAKILKSICNRNYKKIKIVKR